MSGGSLYTPTLRWLIALAEFDDLDSPVYQAAARSGLVLAVIAVALVLVMVTKLSCGP